MQIFMSWMGENGWSGLYPWPSILPCRPIQLPPLLLPPAHVSTKTPQQWGERAQAPGHIYYNYAVRLYWLVMERGSKALQGRAGEILISRR